MDVPTTPAKRSRSSIWLGCGLALLTVIGGLAFVALSSYSYFARTKQFSAATHDPALARAAVEYLLAAQLPTGANISDWMDASGREPHVIFRVVWDSQSRPVLDTILRGMEERIPDPGMMDIEGYAERGFFYPYLHEGGIRGDYPEWAKPLPTEVFWEDNRREQIRVWLPDNGTAEQRTEDLVMVLEYTNSSAGRPKVISDLNNSY